MIKSATGIPAIDRIGGHGFLRGTGTSIYALNKTAVALRLRHEHADRLTLRETAQGLYCVRLFKTKGKEQPEVVAAAANVRPIDLLRTVKRITGLRYKAGLRS